MQNKDLKITYSLSGNSFTSISIQISCLTETGFGNDGKCTHPAYSLWDYSRKWTSTI